MARWNSKELSEILKRRQEVFRLSYEKMRSLPELDENFWEALRASLIETGATEPEIDDLAAHMVTVVVEATRPGDEERRNQLELIGEHLAAKHMRIAIGKDDSHIRVEFPGREEIADP